MSIKEIELAVKTFPQRKLLTPAGFTGEFYTLKANNMSSVQTFPEKWGGDTFQLIPWGQPYPDTKTRQKYHKKRQLQFSLGTEM